MFPLWPRLYRPGCGQYERPCGFAPVAMVAITAPVCEFTTEIVPLYRLEIQSCDPSGDCAIMSGVPPIIHVAMTWRVAMSITESEPPRRLVTNSLVASRLIPMPCAPGPAWMNPAYANVVVLTRSISFRTWFAT